MRPKAYAKPPSAQIWFRVRIFTPCDCGECGEPMRRGEDSAVENQVHGLTVHWACFAEFYHPRTVKATKDLRR